MKSKAMDNEPTTSNTSYQCSTHSLLDRGILVMITTNTLKQTQVQLWPSTSTAIDYQHGYVS